MLPIYQRNLLPSSVLLVTMYQTARCHIQKTSLFIVANLRFKIFPKDSRIIFIGMSVKLVALSA